MQRCHDSGSPGQLQYRSLLNGAPFGAAHPVGPIGLGWCPNAGIAIVLLFFTLHAQVAHVWLRVLAGRSSLWLSGEGRRLEQLCLVS